MTSASDSPNSAQQGAAPAQLWEAHRQLVLATERVLTSEIDAALRLLAEAIRASAPTPEYVAGWLARGEADAAALISEGRSRAMQIRGGLVDILVAAIRALAPPSAPPATDANGVWLPPDLYKTACALDALIHSTPDMSGDLRDVRLTGGPKKISDAVRAFKWALSAPPVQQSGPDAVASALAGQLWDALPPNEMTTRLAALRNKLSIMRRHIKNAPHSPRCARQTHKDDQCNCWKRKVRLDGSEPEPDDDRLLLLKALGGVMAVAEGWEADAMPMLCKSDHGGKPHASCGSNDYWARSMISIANKIRAPMGILTDELRAALIKATEAKP